MNKEIKEILKFKEKAEKEYNEYLECIRGIKEEIKKAENELEDVLIKKQKIELSIYKSQKELAIKENNIRKEQDRLLEPINKSKIELLEKEKEVLKREESLNKKEEELKNKERDLKNKALEIEKKEKGINTQLSDVNALEKLLEGNNDKLKAKIEIQNSINKEISLLKANQEKLTNEAKDYKQKIEQMLEASIKKEEMLNKREKGLERQTKHLYSQQQSLRLAFEELRKKRCQ